jgi:hypothetical protein
MGSGSMGGSYGGGPRGGSSFSGPPGGGRGSGPRIEGFRYGPDGGRGALRSERAFRSPPGNRDHRRDRRRFYYNNSGIWIGPGYYYSSCEWMRRRAIQTGSGYWWSRYNACVGYD